MNTDTQSDLLIFFKHIYLLLLLLLSHPAPVVRAQNKSNQIKSNQIKSQCRFCGSGQRDRFCQDCCKLCCRCDSLVLAGED